MSLDNQGKRPEQVQDANRLQKGVMLALAAIMIATVLYAFVLEVAMLMGWIKIN